MSTRFEASLEGEVLSLSIEVHRLGRSGVQLRMSGELDLSNAEELSRAVAGIGPESGGRVVLDVSGLRFCDAAGVAALLRAQQSVHGAGGHLEVRGASGEPRRVLGITGMDRVFDVK